MTETMSIQDLKTYMSYCENVVVYNDDNTTIITIPPKEFYLEASNLVTVIDYGHNGVFVNERIPYMDAYSLEFETVTWQMDSLSFEGLLEVQRYIMSEVA